MTLFDVPAPVPRLVYNGSPPSRGTDTSIAAAEKQRTKAPSIRVQILAFVREVGETGATAEEAGAFLAETRNLAPENPASRLSAAARLTELKLGGFVRDSGRRRQTLGQCSAIVWWRRTRRGMGPCVRGSHESTRASSQGRC